MHYVGAVRGAYAAHARLALGRGRRRPPRRAPQVSCAAARPAEVRNDVWHIRIVSLHNSRKGTATLRRTNVRRLVPPSADGADSDAGADEAAEAAAVAALASPPPRLADFGALMSRRPENYEVRLFVINAYSLLAPRVHLKGFDTGDNTAAYLRLALGNKVRHKSFAHGTSSPRARASIVRRTQLRARHTRVICAPNMRHTCVTYVSHTHRIRVTYASHMWHACVTHACAAARAPFPPSLVRSHARWHHTGEGTAAVSLATVWTTHTPITTTPLCALAGLVAWSPPRRPEPRRCRICGSRSATRW